MGRQFIILFCLFMSACTDVQRADLMAFGKPGHVTCYSGGKVILDTMSSGRVRNSGQSDGYEFRDSKTDKMIRVSADCIVEN